jgi:hypothetical protein
LKIISGGQTGVDRAALDAAIAVGLDYGGFIPEGRKAEDGPVNASYIKLRELPQATYKGRTEKNIEDADATLIFTRGRPTNGTAHTIKYARALQEYTLIVDLTDADVTPVTPVIQAWLRSIQLRVLNVAGPRESKSPGIYDKVLEILTVVFRDLAL